MSEKLDITLYYNSLQKAAEAGFPDAIELDDGRYMALASFECDDWEWEVDDSYVEAVIAALEKEPDDNDFVEISV